MVKGTTKQVVVVRVTDSPLFEQAVFLMKDAEGVDAGELLAEARRLAAKPVCPGSKRRRGLRPLLWALSGALPVAAGWIGYILWAS
ncbi:MAG: hypothetical protein IJ357_04355 [Oscillospiraceae bacterium]|nr:hypothetical protein [Oscillospiraceae bacterium]